VPEFQKRADRTRFRSRRAFEEWFPVLFVVFVCWCLVFVKRLIGAIPLSLVISLKRSGPVLYGWEQSSETIIRHRAPSRQARLLRGRDKRSNPALQARQILPKSNEAPLWSAPQSKVVDAQIVGSGTLLGADGFGRANSSARRNSSVQMGNFVHRLEQNGPQLVN